MEFASYWHATAPSFAAAATGPAEGRFDVAVIGGGFTGLGAARKLAMAGARVAVLEARTVGWGASGRNGGHLNNGMSPNFADVAARLGIDRARAMYLAYDAGIETIERIIAEEGIDCAFRRSGKLKLASKPGHVDAIRRAYEAIHAHVDPDTAFLSRADLATEIRSDAFHGAMLQRRSAMMHVGRFAIGLAEAAARRGAVIFQNTEVQAWKKSAGGFELTTTSSTVTAREILLATGAYTSPAFSWFRRRIIPVGSFLIATRPLTQDEVAATMPGDRTCVTSRNIGNYFRLSHDRRLIWGGRARFSAVSDHRADTLAGDILQRQLAEIFPALAKVEIDYCWGGLVDMTADRFPRAGIQDGIHFAMGYSGHGAQIATHMGELMADHIQGRAPENPWAALDWPAVPGHHGKPWFLPFVGAYYKYRDFVS